MNEKIYEALRDEPNVDMIIIKDQFPDTSEIEKIVYEYALKELNKEAEALDL